MKIPLFVGLGRRLRNEILFLFSVLRASVVVVHPAEQTSRRKLDRAVAEAEEGAGSGALLKSPR